MDLYDDLDDLACDYEDLLKIHTGHQEQPPDDEDNYNKNDSDSKSEKSEEDYWPTLFNSEQIKANLINAKELQIEEETSDKVKINPEFLQVAKHLNAMITKKFCYICNRHASSHYLAGCHYKKVLEWIIKKVKTSDSNVLKWIYCAACNIGLDKNDNHYFTESHQRNLEYYCDICQCKFPGPISLGHLSSKHKGNGRTKSSNNITYTTQSSTTSTKHANPQLLMATTLQSLITLTACLVCGTALDRNPRHYSTKKHTKKVRGWIQSSAKTYGLSLENSENLYCSICNDVFTSGEIAHTHYQSQKHKDNMALYCTVCDKVFKSKDQHIRTSFHKKRELKLLKKLEATIDRNKPWPQELAYMITLSKCDICSLKLESHNQAYSHYMSQEHQANVTAWIVNLETSTRAAGSCVSTVLDNPEQFILKSKILHEVKMAIDKLYFSNSIPLRDALEHLKRLNREIANICNKRENDTDAIICEPPPKPRTSMGDTSLQFTNFKLNMELERLKTVLRKIDLIPPELGLQIAGNLVQAMKSLANGEQNINNIDINKIFDVSSCDLFEGDFQHQGKFQEQLDSLESIIIGENSKIDSEVALDVIIRFNVQLESVLDQYRDESDDDSSMQSVD